MPHLAEPILDRVAAAVKASGLSSRAPQRLDEFSAFCAVAPALVHSIDGQGRICDVSDRWLRRFGYRREDVIGRRSADFLTEESRQRAIAELIPAFWRDGACEGVAYSFIARDGEVVEVELSGVMLEIEGEKRSLAFLEDVGERNAALRRLREANDALRQFAGLASHDLRGPLNRVARMADMLQADPGDWTQDSIARHRHVLGRIGDTARELGSLVDAILDLSVNVNARAGCDIVTVRGLIDSALASLASEIAASDAVIDVSTIPDGDAPALRGDSRLLEHVLVNLVDNALKHCGRDRPRIAIEAVLDGSNWRISVTDNGAGIDPAVSGTLFDCCARGDTPAQGSGMGLTLVRRIVEGHGGSVAYESEHVGGARLSLTLPVCSGERTWARRR